MKFITAILLMLMIAALSLGCSSSDETPTPAEVPGTTAQGELPAPTTQRVELPSTEPSATAATSVPTGSSSPTIPAATVADPELSQEEYLERLFGSSTDSLVPAGEYLENAHAEYAVGDLGSTAKERTGDYEEKTGIIEPAGGSALPDTEHDAMTGSGRSGIPSVPEHGGRRPHPRTSAPEASEINDNEAWADYLQYESAYAWQDVKKTNLRERYVITVTGEDELPVHNATVVVERPSGGDVATYQTHANGQALHHGDGAVGHEPWVFVAIKGKQSTHKEIQRNPEGGTVRLVLPNTGAQQDRIPVDVLFLLDSTGSMSDEINRIKETLTSISERVGDLPGNPDLRMGMVSYRDYGDTYVNRLYDFDSDARRFAGTVRGVRASGGGDTPEALTEALVVALEKPTWRADAVRLIFLIADAPPQDYDNQLDYDAQIATAQEKGIKIFAVASSGLDEQGEYIFRQMAQQTMGHFIFLLYKSGPQGELTTPHDVGSGFSVEKLDSIIVRLITAELQSMTEAHPQEAGN